MVPLTLFYALVVGSSVSLGMRFGLKFTGLAFALACFASFGWAARIYFGRRGGVTRSQRRVLGSMYATAILHGCAILYLNRGTIYHFVIGAALYTFSFVLFWTAAAAASRTRLQLFFSNVPPNSLLTHGPYRLVRHPFYVAYTVAWIAGAVIVDKPWLLATAAVCHWIYYRAARMEEASFQQTAYSLAYARYAQAVGMFLPRVPSGLVLRQWLLENLAPPRSAPAVPGRHLPAPHFPVPRVTPAPELLYQAAESG
jgi:protein-S-isoprenylcysteine O-methyltransferase Ste14